MKYVVVSGGVVSGLGKGVTASSIGLILKSCGFQFTAIKIDPYLNIDAGTMSPIEHGEFYVLDDGGEVDLDLGNYERFMDIKLTSENNITTGKVYKHVLEKERRRDYLGKTVQVVPHITDAIQEWIERAARIPVDGQSGPADVCVIELGGTFGDIESLSFIEDLEQFSYRVGSENFCLIHVILVPVLNVVGEQKTKPFDPKKSVRDFRGLGLSPNILACRSTKENSKKKEEGTTYATRRPGWFGFLFRGLQLKASPSGSSPGHGGNNIDVPPPPGHGGNNIDVPPPLEHDWNNIHTDSGDEGPAPKIGDIIIPRI